MEAASQKQKALYYKTALVDELPKFHTFTLQNEVQQE